MKESNLYKVRMQDRKLVVFTKDQSGNDRIILAMNKDFIVSLEVGDKGLDVFCKYDNEISKRFTLTTDDELQSSEVLSLIHKTRVEYAKLAKLKLRLIDEEIGIKEIPLKSIQTLNIVVERDDEVGEEIYDVVINSTTEGETKYSYIGNDVAKEFYDVVDKIVTTWNDKINDFSLSEGLMLQSDLHINT